MQAPAAPTGSAEGRRHGRWDDDGWGMLMRLAVEVGLPVPPREAGDVLVAWETQAAWMRDADRVTVESDTRAGVGTMIAVRTRVLNVPMFTERLEVVAWEPPHRLVIAHRRFIAGTGTWELEPAGSGSRFRWTEDIALPLPVVGELALTAYRPIMRRLMSRSVAALRRTIERDR
jgi:Polyketide cyclase / dehydrase and lipid transport